MTGDRCSSVPMLQLLSSAMHEVGRRAGRTFSSQPRCSWLAGWLAGFVHLMLHYAWVRTRCFPRAQTISIGCQPTRSVSSSSSCACSGMVFTPGRDLVYSDFLEKFIELRATRPRCTCRPLTPRGARPGLSPWRFAETRAYLAQWDETNFAVDVVVAQY